MHHHQEIVNSALGANRHYMITLLIVHTVDMYQTSLLLVVEKLELHHMSPLLLVEEAPDLQYMSRLLFVMEALDLSYMILLLLVMEVVDLYLMEVAFGRSYVVQAIRRLIDQYIDGPWISFEEIPKEVIEQIWVKFKDQRQDEKIKTNYKFVIQERHRDIMNTYRERSTKMAITTKHDISMEGIDFDIMLDFIPRGMQSQRWEDLCTEWNTDVWLKRSMSGKSNRNTTNSGGNISRHTMGSISYDEHRIRLTTNLERPPTFLELFLFTRLDKASKKKYFAGDVEGKKFCTERAREPYEAYSRPFLEKYGDDLRDHPIDDAELWAKTQREISGASRSSYIYGIGSLGIDFLFNGKSSSAAGVCHPLVILNKSH
ncbi:unnamed protein product [Lactuca virosa]|uniref:Uncharacterized protein n=1 Tax=Lactuca virosa TaxID=75947 RepID=A0AAU9N257_9ASTR|nr:unnamed protein product [Lactuca virosa]